MERTNMWKTYSANQLTELEQVSNKYKKCLDAGKTERECVFLAVQMAKEQGYQNLEDCIKKEIQLKPGDKVYAECIQRI